MRTNTDPGPGHVPGAHQGGRNDATSVRRVLGEVSPNVRASAVPPASHLTTSKPMAGSPLKRSYTAAIESGNGFTYLKKRKMSSDTPLNQQYNSHHSGNSSRNAASVGHAHVGKNNATWI
jgi:hypothetical protein